MAKRTFNIPKNFKIGTSASAWQTEGWKGKLENQISWADAFYKAVPERWYEGYGTAVATDFYSRYKEDIAIMKELGLQSYRTSIDWSRFITNYETAEVSEDALRFYNDVINELIDKGIQPIICLEHWELPDYLIKNYGGWGSKKVIEFYLKYVEKVFEAFSDRVKIWYTFNEPIVVPMLGISEAMWYPFKSDYKEFMQWNYNKVLATAKAVKLFREKGYHNDGGKIGIIINASPTYPRSDNEADKAAAEMAELLTDRIYMDPCILGTFPGKLIETLKKHNCLFDYTADELALIKNNTIDILGINYYAPRRVKARTSKWNEEIPFSAEYYFENWSMPGAKMNVSRGWEIYARGLYDLAMTIKYRYNNIEWMVMENGMGVMGEEAHKDANGVIQDDYRIDYVADHLRWLFKAVEEGANCVAYHMWNFTDNVSPMNAFRNRYGFVEIDLKDNRNRRIKKSGHWIKEVIKNGKFEYDDFQYDYK
ncbi:glycoside hydrolase family 1 protein [Fonticella tunisiensis]|uniref:Beta-glucosidase n=1 Tax=Fonticella tunisiensis TaxID=1096341 RepID=A0A4R7KRG1_9CLOT|nr:glycoside hydrolase family 1 protein [Fonticella tunisiensis]TDT61284.1 beta-glucosidase [Fonticella tunisiensis]